MESNCREDRKIQPIVEAIKTHNYKGAQKLTKKLLQKSKNYHLARALQCVCLIRQGHHEGIIDAWSLVSNHGKELDERTCNIVAAVLTESGQYERCLKMCEIISNANPNDSNSMIALFYGLVRLALWLSVKSNDNKPDKLIYEITKENLDGTTLWTKAQQVAMKLTSLDSVARTHWVLMCLLMQHFTGQPSSERNGIRADSVQLRLAERFLSKGWVELIRLRNDQIPLTRVEADAVLDCGAQHRLTFYGLRLHLTVYKELNNWQKCLDILNDIQLSSPFLLLSSLSSIVLSRSIALIQSNSAIAVIDYLLSELRERPSMATIQCLCGALFEILHSSFLKQEYTIAVNATYKVINSFHEGLAQLESECPKQMIWRLAELELARRFWLLRSFFGITKEVDADHPSQAQYELFLKECKLSALQTSCHNLPYYVNVNGEDEYFHKLIIEFLEAFAPDSTCTVSIRPYLSSLAPVYSAASIYNRIRELKLSLVQSIKDEWTISQMRRLVTYEYCLSALLPHHIHSTSLLSPLRSNFTTAKKIFSDCVQLFHIAHSLKLIFIRSNCKGPRYFVDLYLCVIQQLLLVSQLPYSDRQNFVPRDLCFDICIALLVECSDLLPSDPRASYYLLLLLNAKGCSFGALQYWIALDIKSLQHQSLGCTVRNITMEMMLIAEALRLTQSHVAAVLDFESQSMSSLGASMGECNAVAALDIISSAHHLRSSIHANTGVLANAYLRLIHSKTTSEIIEQFELMTADLNINQKEKVFTAQRIPTILKSSRIYEKLQFLTSAKQNLESSRQESSFQMESIEQLPNKSETNRFLEMEERDQIDTSVHCNPYMSQLTLMFAKTEPGNYTDGITLWDHLKSLRGLAATNHHLSYSAWINSMTLFIERPNCRQRGSDIGTLMYVSGSSRYYGSFYNSEQKYYGIAGLIKEPVLSIRAEYEHLCLILISCEAIIGKDISKLMVLSQVSSTRSVVSTDMPNTSIISAKQHHRNTISDMLILLAQIFQCYPNSNRIENQVGAENLSVESIMHNLTALSDGVFKSLKTLDREQYCELTCDDYRELFRQCSYLVEYLLLISTFVAVVTVKSTTTTTSAGKPSFGEQNVMSAEQKLYLGTQQQGVHKIVPTPILRKFINSLMLHLESISKRLTKLVGWIEESLMSNETQLDIEIERKNIQPIPNADLTEFGSITDLEELKSFLEKAFAVHKIASISVKVKWLTSMKRSCLSSIETFSRFTFLLKPTKV